MIAHDTSVLGDAGEPDRSATIPALLRDAFLHHRAGRLIPATICYQLVLALHPSHGKALLMFGLLRTANDAAPEGEKILRRSVCLATSAIERGTALFELAKLRQAAGDDEPAVALFEAASRDSADQAAVQRGLALSLQRLGRRDAALAAIDRALAMDAAFAPAQFNRGLILNDMQQSRAATESFRVTVLLAPGWSEAWAHLGDGWRNQGALAQAESALRRAIAVKGDASHPWFLLAQTLERQKRFAEARACNLEAARRHGVQRHPCTQGTPLARILLIGGAGSCNLPPEFLFDRRRYELQTTYLLPPEAPDADLADMARRLPPFDMAFNAIADPDRGSPFLQQAAALCRLIDRPVLNPPGPRLDRTRREQIAALLTGVDDLLVPATRRLARDALTDALLSSGPLLLRPIGSHGGEELRRVEDCAQLEGYRRTTEMDWHYATDFVDYADQDGHYRKYRFIFVDREVYPYHLAIGRQWLLHYISSDMANDGGFRREEERFLADWRAVLPAAAAAAVDEVARRLDLDYAGIDCGITQDGRLLLFEANPCMLVHLRDSPERYPYKHLYVPRIARAIDRMVERRLAASAEPKEPPRP